MRTLLLAGAFLAAPAGDMPAGAAAAEWAAVDDAVSAELARSMSSMKQEGYPPPYYLAIRVSDTRNEEVRCELGGVLSRSSQRQRLMTPDLRVGGRDLDNHPLAPSSAFSASELPQTAEAASIQHAIWEDLDERYKGAAAGFLYKQAQRVRRGKTEYDTDDMTRESPLVLDAAGFRAEADLGAEASGAEPLCAGASAAFKAKPDLLGSEARLRRQSALETFRDSEGARVHYGRSLARLELRAEALSPDGMRVFARRAFMARTAGGLPGEEAVRAAGAEMLADLTALQAASSTSPVSAPALVDATVAAAVLQAIVTRMSGEEQRDPDGAQTFRDKLGKRVLPEFLTIEDDPTLAEYKGRPLLGHYAVDDQGVAPSKVTLIESGILKGFLLSRYPVIGFDRSNGHGRAQPGRLPMGRAGNIILKSTVTAGGADLVDLLRKECRKRGKPYGLIIERERAWMQQDRTGQQQALRLMPTLVYLVDAKTGRQTLVRDLDMVGTPLDLAGKIIAAGDAPEVVDAMTEQASGSLPASVVTPPLLLSEVELQRAETKPEKPPALPAPKP